jgi:DHA2 family multidrug resistance protein
MTNLLRSVASSVSVAIMTTLLARNIQTSHSDLVSHITSQSLPFDLRLTQALGDAGNTVMAMVDAEVNRQAVMIAYLDDFKVLMRACIVVVPLVLLLRAAAPLAQLKPVAK